MVYLEINSSKKLNKTKFLKEKSDVLSDNEDLILEHEVYAYSTITKQKVCDYLVVYDLEEEE